MWNIINEAFLNLNWQYRSNMFQVIAGAHNIFEKTPSVQERNIFNVFFYNVGNMFVDIAIILLNLPLKQFDDSVRPIELAQKDFYPKGKLVSFLLITYMSVVSLQRLHIKCQIRFWG